MKKVDASQRLLTAISNAVDAGYQGHSYFITLPGTAINVQVMYTQYRILMTDDMHSTVFDIYFHGHILQGVKAMPVCDVSIEVLIAYFEMVTRNVPPVKLPSL
jgi:hypothetical protein